MFLEMYLWNHKLIRFLGVLRVFCLFILLKSFLYKQQK